MIGAATIEMWNSANMSFALCPLLTAGATEAIKAHASDELKSCFLPKLVSGEWAGTMNLTEPQAGSDLSAVRMRAVPEGEHYRLFGQKIFITWGDHDMAENIVHLVLARLPDAPGARAASHCSWCPNSSSARTARRRSATMCCARRSSTSWAFTPVQLA